MARRITLSVAQLQTLAQRTEGFHPGKEVTLFQPYPETTDVGIDVYHVRTMVEHDGRWFAMALKDGEPEWGIAKGERAKVKFDD